MTNKIKYLLFILLFVFIPNVKALNTSDWIQSLDPYRRIFIYQGFINGGYSKDLAEITYYNTVSTDGNGNPTTSGATYQLSGVYNTETGTINSSGLGYYAQVGSLEKGMMYSYTTYVCSNVNLLTYKYNLFLGISGDSPYEYGYDTTYLRHDYSTISTYPSSNRGNYNYCYVFSNFFVPESYSTYISTFFTSSTSKSGVTIYPIGYKLENMGYYRDEYKKIIEEVMDKNFSNVATKQDVQNKVNEVKQQIREVSDTISNNDTSESTDEANSFFSGFTTETFGLTSIITAPLNLIGNITSSKCSPLPLEAPFVNTTINLPCMSTIYNAHFGSFLTIYQTITFGIVAYWVCVRLFNLVKDFKNPDHDEIEVMDL